jgi:hypothetical protein
MNITLITPGNVQSVVETSDDATVRDVATFKYHLFWRITKRNGVRVCPFVTKVTEGDTVSIEKRLI